MPTDQNPEYIVNMRATHHRIVIHHPNHGFCHIQLIARSAEGYPMSLDSNQFEMLTLPLSSKNDSLPFLTNFHGIETNVGSTWRYVRFFDLTVKNGRSFAEVLGENSRLYAISIPCVIPEEFKLTH